MRQCSCRTFPSLQKVVLDGASLERRQWSCLSIIHWSYHIKDVVMLDLSNTFQRDIDQIEHFRLEGLENERNENHALRVTLKDLGN